MDFSLNNYFEKVYVINMDSDKDRLESVTKELNKINTTFTKVPGIIADKSLRKQDGTFFGKYFAPSSAIGISEAHRKIWKLIIEKKYKNALIFEDDVKFTDNISDIIPKAIDELPKDWDILYLGCLTCCDKVTIFELPELINPTKKKYSEHLNIGGIYYGAEAYVLSYNGAKKLLDQLPKISHFPDYEISYNTKNLNIYHLNPVVAFQHSENIIKTHYSNIPVILNNIIFNIRINDQCFNDIRTLDWIMSLPIFRLFSDLLTFNLWCIVFFFVSFLFPSSFHILIIYIIIDIIYNKFKKIYKYIPILLATILGYLIRKLI